MKGIITLNSFRRAIFAGLLIALAGAIFINCQDKIVGSVLFSIGLISVILYQTDLFTGKVGYINSKQTFLQAVFMLAINLVVAFLVGLVVYYTSHHANVEIMMQDRIDLLRTKPWWTFLRGMGCGALIYLAVDLYKASKNLVTVILPVAAFILAGFYHCVADAFYWGAAGAPILGLPHVLLVAVGNSVGSLLIRFLKQE